MIDKPKGKTEILLDNFFEWCRTQIKKLDQKTSGHRSAINTFRGNHPRIAKTVVVTGFTLAVGLVIVGFATPKTVIVNIDDSVQVTTTEYETTCTRVDTFIETHGIDYVYGEDVIDVELYTGISNDMEINIQKAVHIPVTADGETNVITTLPIKVEDLLKELDIEVGKEDIVEPDMEHTLRNGDELHIKRVTTGYVTEEVETQYSTVYVNDYSMAIGKTEVLQEGAIGKEEKTYLVTFIDGEESSRELSDSRVLQEKQDKIIGIGMNISSGIPSGLQYTMKISGVRAVSYHFSGNPKGAYGLACTYGTCAVDKDVIPLGSLLYIEGYGYAIANDVGGSIKGNTVDLYMEDISQCGRWGARTVNVYVIS